MSDFAVVDFPKLRSLIESGSSGVVDVRADLHRALAELDWRTQRAPTVREVAAPAEPDQWLTPEKAAALIPDVSVGQVRSWSKGDLDSKGRRHPPAWAARPSKRCLRIHEQKFRLWLASRREAI